MNQLIIRFKKIMNELLLKNWFNVLILVLLCLIFYAITAFQNTITWRTDSYFHFNRIHDITESIKSFNIPNVINYSSFDYTGQAVNAMYPSLTLLPFIALTAWLQPIEQYAIINFLFIATGSVLNYFVFQKFNHSKVQSLVATISFFPIINIFSSYHLSLHGVWGIYFLLPLAILSVLKMSRGHKYYVLTFSISISLLINLHVLSSILSVLLLSTLFLVLITKVENKKKFLSFFLAGSILSAILSLPTLVNIILFSSNKLTSVNHPILTTHTMTLEDMIHSLSNLPFAGTSTPEIYGYLLILDVFICLNWHKFESKNTKRLLIVSYILQLCISPYFPWSLLQNTPIAIIQFPNRIVPLIITLQILGIFTNSHFKDRTFLFTFAMLSIFLTMSHIWTNYSERRTLQLVTPSIINKSIQGKIDTPSVNETKIDTNDMNSQNFYQLSSFIEYVPTKSMKNAQNSVNANEKSVNQHIIYTNNKIIAPKKMTNTPNRITYYFNKPQTGEINLPFWNYQNIKYNIYSNGKKIKYGMSKRNTILLKNKSVYTVTVTSSNPSVYNFSLVICIMSWIAIIILLITKIKKLGFQNVTQ